MSRLIIVSGNIGDDSLLKEKDAFVLPTNPKMRYGAGVSEVAFRKAGIDILEKYCEDTFDVGYEISQEKNNMKPAEIRITPGFGLGMDIIFVQSPNTIYFSLEENKLYPLLFKTYRNVLNSIRDNGYKNVIMPSLGTGHYGFDHEAVASNIVPMINRFLDENKDVDITLCLFNDEIKSIYSLFNKNE